MISLHLQDYIAIVIISKMSRIQNVYILVAILIIILDESRQYRVEDNAYKSSIYALQPFNKIIFIPKRVGTGFVNFQCAYNQKRVGEMCVDRSVIILNDRGEVISKV